MVTTTATTKCLMGEFFPVVTCHSILLVFSLMSVFHRGICTLAVHHEKSLVPAFFKVPVDHLFANVHCNDSGKINYCCGKKS